MEKKNNSNIVTGSEFSKAIPSHSVVEIALLDSQVDNGNPLEALFDKEF